MKQFLTSFQIAIDWIRRHVLFILLGILGCFTAAAVIRRKTNNVNTVGDAIAVQRARAKALVLKKQQNEIERKDATKADEILKLNQAIVEQHKVIAESVRGRPWEELSDTEIRESLREAGL